MAVSGGNTYPADFGYYGAPAALGDSRLGRRRRRHPGQPGEPGLPGVEVTLTIDWPNATDTTVVTTTDANGDYSFDNLLLDEDYNASTTGDPATTGLPKFTITVATPTGGTPTLIGQGGDSALDSNDPAGTVAEVEQGQTNDTYDFGYTGLGTVDGRVYEDVDGSGTFTAGDLPQAGVTVTITDSNNVVRIVTTDANGLFSEVVPAGATTVDVDETTLTTTNPILTTDASGEGSDPTVVTVPSGGTATDNTGYVERHHRADGDRQGLRRRRQRRHLHVAGDMPQVGATVVITASNGGIYTVTTDANGDFSQAVPAGATTVDVDETTLSITNPTLTTNASNEGTDPTTVTVPAAARPTTTPATCTNATAQSVTGKVYEDINGNGIFDARDRHPAGRRHGGHHRQQRRRLHRHHRRQRRLHPGRAPGRDHGRRRRDDPDDRHHPDADHRRQRRRHRPDDGHRPERRGRDRQHRLREPRTSRVDGHLYVDTNGNGTQDAGEPTWPTSTS